MKLHKIVLSAFAALTLAACNDEIPVPGNANKAPVTDQEVVSIPLVLEIADEEGNTTAASRAVEDTETGVNAKIHNVWVLQFKWEEDGTAATDSEAMKDNAELAYWEYIPDYDATKATKSTATFVITSQPCFVVILGNTNNPELERQMGYDLKYSDLKLWRDVITSQSDLFTTAGTEDTEASFPDNFSNHIIRFNGIKAFKSGISNTTSNVTVLLRRNIARIDVDCVIAPELKATGTDFAIDRLELCNVPDHSYFLTNGNYTPTFTGGLLELTREDGTPERFPIDATCHHIKFDNPIITPAASLPSGIDYRARFYAPVNQRGKHLTDERYASEKYKSLSAPAHATYLRVLAHYTRDGEMCPVEYTYYLGADLGETATDTHSADLKHDFNIVGNHTYKYTLNFDALPDPEHDPRVEDYGNVTFPQDEFANCYILNPGTRAGQCRRFNIPVGRVDEFWGSPILGNEPDKCLADTREWVAEIVWSDFKVSEFNASRPENEKFQIVKSEGRGNKDYFTVAVPPGMVGNVVVGVKKNASDEEYLWSWHLWITDYNPDREFAISQGTYLYPVSGGNICRLGGADWESGEYKNAFMMDRFLGATSRPEPEYPATLQQSCLYYEYGRKDPFYQQYYADGETKKSNFNFVVKSVDFEYYVKNSIANPTVKYRCGSHLDYSDCTMCPAINSYSTKMVWHDRRIPQNTYPGNGLKSIFDPSPLGWIVPTLDAFSDLATANGTTNAGYTNIDNINNYREGLPLYELSNTIKDGYYNGVVYWPKSTPWEDRVPETAIYFHVTGYISLNVNTSDYPKNSCGALTTTYSSLARYTNFVGYNFASGGMMSAGYLYAYAVRCVKLPKLNK